MLAAIAAADDPPIVVVDTTLTGTSRTWEAARRALMGSRAPLVVCLRSGLKLDQEGLELSNLGVVECWAHAANPRLAQFRMVAAACRVATSTMGGRPCG